jgi:7-cyano-7-deazaguanine synthase
LDSAIAILRAMDDSKIERVEPLFVNRNQRARDDERKAATAISRIIGTSELCESYVTMPWYEKQRSLNPNAFPRGRNFVLGAIAASYASTAFPTCSSEIIVGFTKDDSSIVADSSEEFVSSLNGVARECIEDNSGNSRVKFVAPLIGTTKSEAVKWLATQPEGEALAAASWSCYHASTSHGGMHCGTCAACNRRRKAFQSAGMADPTCYESTMNE